MKKAASALSVVLMLFLTGCMTYRDFPRDYVGKVPTTKPFPKLNYKIEKSNTLSLGGGPGTLRQVFRSHSPFLETEAVEEIPAKGVYCHVSVEPKDIGLGVVVAGYISYSTLTLLPVWSTKDGYFLKYDLYVDGEKKQRFEYEVTRKAAVWAGLLPFVWVNALTYSEEEAVQATANKFFKESESIILAHQQKAGVAEAVAP